MKKLIFIVLLMCNLATFGQFPYNLLNRSESYVVKELLSINLNYVRNNKYSASDAEFEYIKDEYNVVKALHINTSDPKLYSKWLTYNSNSIKDSVLYNQLIVVNNINNRSYTIKIIDVEFNKVIKRECDVISDIVSYKNLKINPKINNDTIPINYNVLSIFTLPDIVNDTLFLINTISGTDIKYLTLKDKNIFRPKIYEKYNEYYRYTNKINSLYVCNIDSTKTKYIESINNTFYLYNSKILFSNKSFIDTIKTEYCYNINERKEFYITEKNNTPISYKTVNNIINKTPLLFNDYKSFNSINHLNSNLFLYGGVPVTTIIFYGISVERNFVYYSNINNRKILYTTPEFLSLLAIPASVFVTSIILRQIEKIKFKQTYKTYVKNF